jgi:hypothetical protein
MAAVAVATVLATLVVAGVSPASASTLNGIATIATPGTSTPLTSGGSTTSFTVSLPSQSAGSGDTASGGYHVYSYLVPRGTNLSTVTFVGFPSTGYVFVDNTGLYYGPVNTAIKTGQIIGIPNNFQWGPLVSSDGVPKSTLLYTGGTSGVWEAGLACANTHGALSDNWNTEVTFNAKAGDPNGFTWTDGLYVSTKTLPAGTRGKAYKVTLHAAGGKAPYVWKSTSALPKGLTLSTAGVLSGTPAKSLAAKAYPIKVQVTDATKPTKLTATATLSLTLS